MDQKEKTDIRSLNLKELTVFMEQLGEKAFRAKHTIPLEAALTSADSFIAIAMSPCGYA